MQVRCRFEQSKDWNDMDFSLWKMKRINFKRTLLQGLDCKSIEVLIFFTSQSPNHAIQYQVKCWGWSGFLTTFVLFYSLQYLQLHLTSLIVEVVPLFSHLSNFINIRNNSENHNVPQDENKLFLRALNASPKPLDVLLTTSPGRHTIQNRCPSWTLGSCLIYSFLNNVTSLSVAL